MQNIETRTFQTEYPVYAHRSFTAAGRRYQRGQEFPWKPLGIKPETVEALYKVGKVRHRPQAPVEQEVKADDQIPATNTAPAKRKFKRRGK